MQGLAQEQLWEGLALKGLNFSEWLCHRRSAPRQAIELALPLIPALKARDARRTERHRAECERILKHEFDLLGSGPFSSVDRDRPVRPSGYRPIDWYADPVRDLHFRRDVPFKEWKLYEMRPANADVKHPWELARCQHLVTLAQGWAVHGESRFAREFENQLNDFIEAHPVGIGVNWTCTMDVGLRVVSWCHAFALLQTCKDLSDRFWARAYEYLFDQARFIFANLENHYEVTSNHFLANVIGLHFASAELAGMPEASDWDVFCRDSLEREIVVQVCSDGADFESGLHYHRLVTEMFMSSGRLAQVQNRLLSEDYYRRLGDMVSYAAGMVRPDGLSPVIGDADDGRCQILSEYGYWNRQDTRHLFAPAALMLKRSDLAATTSDVGPWEATWWGFDPAQAAHEFAPPNLVKLFPDIGHAVTRHDGNFLVVTNGIVGTKGFGNHKHNELLGFEYMVGGAPLIVDPGSYVYTCDFGARNLFRSTKYHNTITIDGEEQNEMNPEWIFRLFEKANPVHVAFSEGDGLVRYAGRHSGYERFPEPVSHERAFAFDKLKGNLRVVDVLSGAGFHGLDWRFHGAPGAQFFPAEKGRIRIASRGVVVDFRYDERLEARVVPAWYSPSYGARVGCEAIELHLRTDLGGRFETEFGFTTV